MSELTRIPCQGSANAAFKRTDGGKPSKKNAAPACQNFIEVLGPVSPNVTYLCRQCSPVASPPPNTFQGKQFVKDLNRSAKPEGTRHVKNQGTDIIRQKDNEWLTTHSKS